ncbi:O-antigen ligase family protein [Novipirellula artificiosorum]|nr:O-antigen ligase family protein [Novipirellula artificiosorum]
MQDSLIKLRTISIWVSAAILTSLPCLVALDYAGVLKWTQWAAAIAIFVAALFALPALNDRENQGNPGFHWFFCILVGWAGFAWFQTLPLPASIQSLLSSGSAEAYTTWIIPIVGSAATESMHPISIDPWNSRHGVAVLLMLATLAWTSGTVFQTRARLATVLVGLAAGAAIHAGLGIFRMVVPDADALGMDVVRYGSPFAGFVCRNNAALLMNIGVGTSLGLLAWRLSALIGQEVDDEHFEVNDLISLVSDRDSSIALGSLVLCTAALLVCGSRGGLVAALFGFLLAFGWIRARRGLLSIPVILGVVTIATVLLLVPLNLDLKSIQRLELFVNRDNSTLLHDGRIPHWTDGFTAAKAYLPMGSGLGTYADAHLPYLDRSAEAWFYHADNLYLEMLTEQGIVGILLTIAILVGLVISLHRLKESPDPVDHGLRVAGWYILAALVVSQFFDFGLIIPANLIACCVFFPIVASRRFLLASHMTEEDERLDDLEAYEDDAAYRDEAAYEDEDREQALAAAEQPPRVRFQTPRTVAVSAGVAAVAIVPAVWAISVLGADAKVDALARQARFALNDNSVEAEELETLTGQLEKIADQTGAPEAYRALSDLHHRIGRYDEVANSNPKSIEQIQELYRQTSPLIRRQSWLKTQPAISTTSESTQIPSTTDTQTMEPSPTNPVTSTHYVMALQNAKSELLSRPLSREARSSSLYLDFVDEDRERTKALLKQLQSLYKTNTPAMQKIGSLALDSNEREIAAECFRTVLKRRPSSTNSILNVIQSHPDLSAAEIVPPSAVNYRNAARFYISRPSPDLGFLETAFGELACDQCQTVAERAACEELAGDTAYVLEKYTEAFESYKKAIEFKPNDVRLRIKLIGRLRAQGNRDEALVQARDARNDMPNEDRFEVIIRQIRDAELQEFEKQ